MNIARLIRAFPDHEFIYLIFDNRLRYVVNKIKNLIKEIMLTVLLKHPDWYSARRLAEAKIRKLIPRKFDAHIKRIYVNSVNDDKTERIIRDLKPDLLFQCGAGILKSNIFSIPPLGTLNIHHGIAPEIRGISSTFWAMYYGMIDYIGATVHFIDKNLDTGVVIIQRKTSLPEQYDYVEAVYQTALQGAELLPEAINIILSEYSTIETEVQSFYFSSVAWSIYRELSKNKFKEVGDVNTLKYKFKCKKMLLPHVRHGSAQGYLP